MISSNADYSTRFQHSRATLILWEGKIMMALLDEKKLAMNSRGRRD